MTLAVLPVAWLSPYWSAAGRLRELQPVGRFDLIANSFALPAQLEQAKVFATIRKALTPDGRVLTENFDSAMMKRKEFSGFHCPGSGEQLEQYFVSKKPQDVTQEYIANLGRGIAYTKSAPYYLFRCR